MGVHSLAKELLCIFRTLLFLKIFVQMLLIFLESALATVFHKKIFFILQIHKNNKTKPNYIDY